MRIEGPARDRIMLKRGVAASIVLAFVLGLLFAQARGTFRNDPIVTASLSSIGDGLPPGSDVKYRGVLVGAVTKVNVTTAGADVKIRLKPRYASGIPAGVVVRRVPSNIFAQPALELADGTDSKTTRRISNGDVLAEDTSRKSLEIQSAIERAYELITAVKPAEITAALDAIADAFDGQGKQMGRVLAQADSYFAKLARRSPQIDRLLRRTASAVEQARDLSPAVLASVRDALVPARAFAARRASVRALLSSTQELVDLGDDFLGQNGERIISILRRARPVGLALGADVAQIPESFAALGRFASFGRRVPQGAHGPEVRLDFQFSDTVLRPYVARDCPRYPSVPGVPAMSGSNCRATQIARSEASGGTVGPVGSPSEKAAIASVAPNGDAGGDATELLLGPLLRGGAVMVS